MLDSIVKLIAIFPSWAILLIFFCFSLLVAFLAMLARARAAKKRHATQNDILEKPRTFLKLIQVQLFPEDPAAEINIIIYVNGVAFYYPSETDIKWIPVISNMNEKIIELPCAEMYYIRFEINFSSEKKLEGGPALARGALAKAKAEAEAEAKAKAKKDTQKTANHAVHAYPTVPLVADYKLYLLQDGSRDTSVKANISYEIYIDETHS